MAKELISLRIDDLPLLFTVIQQLGLAKSINTYIKVHGNWEGTLPGDLLELWLCYILSSGDHRLSVVEKWAEQHLELLRVLSGMPSLTSYDFSDDKLGLLLDYFSEDDSWNKIELDVNTSLLGVYRIEEANSLNTFRIDSAPMQGYGQVNEDGLLQYGYHKQHASLPQFKLKLCTLDNTLNYFAYPVTHLAVEGNRADDELYIPIIEESKKVLSGITGYAHNNLFVGDTKFGSLGNRAHVVANQDYYLLPLSLVQLSQENRMALIKKANNEDYQQVFREEKGQQVLVARGFEVTEQLTHFQDNKKHQWTERRLFVLSENHAKAQQVLLEKHLSQAIEHITKLTASKQGKKSLKTKEEYQQAINKIVSQNKVEGLLDINIKETRSTKNVRAYGKRPQRKELTSRFEIFCQRNQTAIETHKLYLGWQVYATNTTANLLSFERCIWKYRHQSNIESRFDDLRNKVAPLLPVFLQKDNRIRGLVNILLMALKVCSMMEYQVAKALKEQKEELKEVYEGNPKRGTTRPSTTRMLKAFEGISISLIFVNKQLQFALMTNLEQVQMKILELLAIKPEVYTDLSAKIEMFFSEKQITET